MARVTLSWVVDRLEAVSRHSPEVALPPKIGGCAVLRLDSWDEVRSSQFSGDYPRAGEISFWDQNAMVSPNHRRGR